MFEQESKMQLSQIQIVSVPVRDQQAAKQYYTQVLSFELVRESPMGEMNWVEVGLPGCPTHLTLVTWFPQMPPGSLQGMVIATPDVQAAHDGLLSRGVPVSEINAAPWGRYFTFSDPDGNGFVIQQNAF
jgi:catechol 2,3-dioxygenase-like lactoylglutathione lyase family enzyme